MEKDVESDVPLPDDQLSEFVFKYIPLCQWSGCLEYVSKQFQRCVQIAYGRIKSVSFEKLFSLKLSRNNWDADRRYLFSKKATTSARLNKILKKLLSVCRNLTEMDGFDYVTLSMDSKSTWNILKQFDRLQSISLTTIKAKIPFNYFADFVTDCKSLKSLNVSFCDFDFNGTLDVGTLTNVDIAEWFPNGTPLLENLSEKLTSLAIYSFGHNFKSTSDAEQAMKLCTNLESFSVGIGTVNDYKIFVNVLPNLCKLTKLRVSFADPYSFDDFDEKFCVALDNVKNQLQSIQFIDLDLSVEIQNFLFTNCLRLQTLDLEEHEPLFTSAIKKLSNFPATLEVLALPSNGAALLPFLLPNLVNLSNFTDLSITWSSRSDDLENVCFLNNLKYLRLSGESVNDALLDKWDRKNDKMFERLISFEIPYCGNVSDVSGCLLAKKATNLQILDLHLSRISEKTILALADVAKKLTTATLSQEDPCLFDENDILSFIKKASCLKTLELLKKMAKKVVQHTDFLPFIEDVEIDAVCLYK